MPVYVGITTFTVGIAGFVSPLAKEPEHHNNPYYFQAAATTILLPLSCIETFLVISTISAFRKLRDEEIYWDGRRRTRRYTLERQNAMDEIYDDDSVS